jgi:hypothetical protein
MMSLIVKNLETLKGGAKFKLVFNKLARGLFVE